MKNWKIIFNTVLVGALVAYLSSCDGGEENIIQDPSVSLAGTDFTQTTFFPGETIDLTLTFTAPQGISGINWQFFDANDNSVGSKEFNNPDTDPDLDAITSADTQGSVDLSIPVPEGTEGQTLTLVFEVIDKSSANSAIADFTFNVETGIESYETVLLGGFQNPSVGSFYNAVGNEIYTVSQAQNNNGSVDFMYYYANPATNPPLNTIASPDSDAAQTTWESQQPTSPWPFTTVENSTKFKPLGNNFDFEGTTTSNQLENAWPETGDELRRITNLEVGQVVAFVLDDSRGSRYGIFEVAAIAGASGVERSITLNVKVQANDN